MTERVESDSPARSGGMDRAREESTARLSLSGLRRVRERSRTPAPWVCAIAAGRARSPARRCENAALARARPRRAARRRSAARRGRWRSPRGRRAARVGLAPACSSRQARSSARGMVLLRCARRARRGARRRSGSGCGATSARRFGGRRAREQRRRRSSRRVLQVEEAATLERLWPRTTRRGSTSRHAQTFAVRIPSKAEADAAAVEEAAAEETKGTTAKKETGA